MLLLLPVVPCHVLTKSEQVFAGFKVGQSLRLCSIIDPLLGVLFPHLSCQFGFN